MGGGGETPPFVRRPALLNDQRYSVKFFLRTVPEPPEFIRPAEGRGEAHCTRQVALRDGNGRGMLR